MDLPKIKTNSDKKNSVSKKIELLESHEYTDPVSWYNFTKRDHVSYILNEIGFVEQNNKLFSKELQCAVLHDNLICFSESIEPFKAGIHYTNFQILVIIRFKGNYFAAINWICIYYLNLDIPYLRIGVDYFKKIQKKDRFGIKGDELKKWKKDEIKDDHGKAFLSKIPKFDNFCLEPNNFDYQPVVENCYNLYHSFRHKESEGEIKWSKILMEHIFGEQANLGYRYLQCLYLHPTKMLPILVLVSRERQTGKTTFLNWLNMIFGDNCVMINPSDLTSDFNSSYATANIIEIEETLIEKSITVEKLKALATGKFVSVNEKFISNYKLPFFGKIILASNNEDKFAKVDEEEIRFFVRKVGKPKFKNHDVENDLGKEIPAFLKYLSSLPAVDFTVGRVPFSVDELKNDTLTAVKKESKTGLYKDMFERFTDLFSNGCRNDSSIFVVPVDIKERWYKNSHNIDIHYIRTVLKNEFNLKPGAAIRYVPFNDGSTYSSKVGTAYEIKKSAFNIDELDEEKGQFIVYNDRNNDLPQLTF